MEAEALPKSQAGAFSHGPYSFRMKLLSNDASTRSFSTFFNFVGTFASLVREVPEGTVLSTKAKPAEAGSVYVPPA